MKFKINSIPPSYNAMFKINYNFKEVYLSDTARAFKQLVKLSMPAIEFKDDSLFKIDIVYCYNWFYKNFNPRKLDIQNMDKLLLDAVFEKLGLDDSRVFVFNQKKVQSPSEVYTEVEITVL